MRQSKNRKRPGVRPVNDETAAMVQDAGAYQRLLDIAARGRPVPPAIGIAGFGKPFAAYGRVPWPHATSVIYRVVESRKEVDILHIRYGALLTPLPAGAATPRRAGCRAPRPCGRAFAPRGSLRAPRKSDRKSVV